jgi:uncharacterized Ntn-hydrolase superfamily protein
MTYTIVGKCASTGQVGLGIATWSLAAAGFCQGVSSRDGAIVSQAVANHRLVPLGLYMMQVGFPARKVLSDLEASDPYFSYRQVGIIDRRGEVAVHTGKDTRPWTGHIVGDGFVALGNFLEGPAVVDAMAEAFDSSQDAELGDRLLRTLEVGRDAGGQAGGVTERSAAVVVHDNKEPYPLYDLRVDVEMEGRAVELLRQHYEFYRPLVPLYYDLLPNHPDKANETGGEGEWEKQVRPEGWTRLVRR